MTSNGFSGRSRVAIAMSGGVDSAVAALLLARSNCSVVGVTLKLWCSEDFPERETEKACCSREAIDDAASVAARLRIPHHVWDFSEEFKREVIDPFRSEYFLGRTPNPCVDCNRHVRFQLLFDKLRQAGFDYLATGHYARIDCTGSRARLLQGADPKKDQSYVLWGMGREALDHTLFPLGSLTKADVRRIARENGISVADKEESQDICFIPDHDLGSFLGGEKEGDVVGRGGEKLGTHRGAARYTVGQRRGLGVSAEEPLYVTAINMEQNEVQLGKKEELLASGALMEQVSLLIPEDEITGAQVEIKIRYKHQPCPADITIEGDGRATVRFQTPQSAVTPGQSAVFYRGEEVLGGGVIDRSVGV